MTRITRHTFKAGDRARYIFPTNKKYDGQPGTVLGPGRDPGTVRFQFDRAALNPPRGCWGGALARNLDPIPT